MKKIRSPYFYLFGMSLIATAVWFWVHPIGVKKGDVLSQGLLSEMDSNAVARIEIEHLLNGVRLKKENGAWFVAELKTTLKKNLDKAEKKSAQEVQPSWFPSDGSRVSMALDVLADTDIVSMVGSNPKRHGSFEVNMAGMEIRFFGAAGEKMGHLFIGKAGTGFMEGFARRDGENEVWLTDRYLRNFFPVEISSWAKSNESEPKKGVSTSTVPKSPTKNH